MYNKLFQKILDSSVWLEEAHVRLVWVTFLAAMDQDGFVALSSVGNVAARARVSDEQAENAIQILESPDLRNPGQDHDGKRVERIPGMGWMVLNAKKYRDMANSELARAQTRARVARHRANKTGNVPVTVCNENVTTSETEANSKTDINTRVEEPPALHTGEETTLEAGTDPEEVTEAQLPSGTLHKFSGFSNDKVEVFHKSVSKFPKKVWLGGESHPGRLFRHFSWRMSQEPRFGGAGIGEPDGKAAKLLNLMFKDTQLQKEPGIELAMEMVDCLVMDWNAIKDMKSLKAVVPDVGLLYSFRTELKVAVLSGSGMVNAIHRSSRWAERSPHAAERLAAKAAAAKAQREAL